MLICVEPKLKQRNYKKGFDSLFEIPGKENENAKKEVGRNGKCKYRCVSEIDPFYMNKRGQFCSRILYIRVTLNIKNQEFL